MNWKIFFSVWLFLFFFFLNTGLAQEAGSSYADLPDEVLANPVNVSNSGEKDISLDANDELLQEQAALGGETFSDAYVEAEESEDEMPSNDTLAIEEAEDELTQPALGGETYTEPSLSPDIDNEIDGEYTNYSDIN